jgi:malate synthase
MSKPMATAAARPNHALEAQPFANRVVAVNSAPADFDPTRDLPQGFLEFLAPLHAALTLRQRALVARREFALAEAHAGKVPDYLPPSVATTNSWRIELPAWCADQRNQMTGPADDADLVVKMLNSGAPGVMLDLEDSNANTWEHNALGIKNILEALAGRLTYFDR